MQKMRKAFLAVLTAALLACVSLFTLVACTPASNDKAAKGIEITTPPTKTDYVVGESFDPAGMVVSVVYEDDSKEALEASAYTLDPTGALAVSNRRITVTYKVDEETEFTATQNITVHNNVVSVVVKTPATKTGYAIGEVFDPTGMVVTVTYEDKSTKDVDITADNVTYDKTPLTGSETEITLTYSGKEIKQAIEFATGITIKTQPTKTEYVPGERFNPAGMVLEVSYTSGKKAEVAVAGSSATYSTEPLTGEETSVTVSYGGFEVTVNITFASGVFIEAEDGIIETSSTQWLREDANETFPEEYQASGYKYVGDLAPGDSISFIFSSDKAGTGNIFFRMASQYLKQDSNWTPIWMGDCQLNKICKVSVNGVDYPIDDSVILPGGGEQDGEANQYLWTNWREVEFRNIAFKQGNNTIKLTFQRHDYADCSQSGKNNVFTANVDSLIITSAECTITALKAKLEATATSATLETKNDVTEFVVKGTVDYEVYTEEDVKEKLTLQIGTSTSWWGQTYFTAVDVATTVTLTGHQFEIRANIDKIGSNAGYTVNFMNAALTIAGAQGSTGTCSHGEFEVLVSDTGVITLKVESKVSFAPTATNADIAVVDGKVIVTVTGTYTATGYDNDEIKALLEKTVLDLQNTNWSGQRFTLTPAEVTLGANNSFTAKYDITAVTNGRYVTHFNGTSVNFVPSANIAEKSVTLGGHKYTISADTTGTEQDTDDSKFYGAVGFVVEDEA